MAKKIPQFGDPEILPKGRIVRPDAERLPFSRAGGVLLPEGEPQRDPAPDLDPFPQWERQLLQGWTDATMRETVRTWLAAFFVARDWPLTWAIVERSKGERGARYALPYLDIRISDAAGTTVSISRSFTPEERSGSQLDAILIQLAAALDAQR